MSPVNVYGYNDRFLTGDPSGNDLACLVNSLVVLIYLSTWLDSLAAYDERRAPAEKTTGHGAVRTGGSQDEPSRSFRFQAKEVSEKAYLALVQGLNSAWMP